LRLVRGLYERGLGAEDVRQLLRFIDWIMELPEPLERRFREDAEAARQETHMRFMDIFERAEIEKALLDGIESCLKVKSGAAGLELLPELREIRDHELLRKVLKRIETAESPEEVRRTWTRKRRPKTAEPK
jgi:hypothetical protein